MARPRSTHRVTCTTGRSDNFTQAQPSTYPRDARFDPESICVARDGASVFISDEYGPCIYRFDRRTGERIAVYRVPASFAVTTLSPDGNDEIGQDASGRVANKGMEGLAISPDIANAQDVSQTSSESGLAPYALAKQPFLDIVKALWTTASRRTTSPRRSKASRSVRTCA
ncbi:hypothetical protein AWB78_03668 [Caballeronia calidae]|uniref:Phytase-like domain-containing protein n=1 Tax=Caballeronia calidae TaxID=1777139 RepID=A0A158C9W5_9BURK|nr:esterase-like activity of phytase family protein [Caballeronia calidae]SAK79143.1 hypothetical protein AWB78_03668 [Caballeronia calidae]